MSRFDESLIENDPLDSIEGPFSVIRGLLKDRGVMVLPHPVLGFCDDQKNLQALHELAVLKSRFAKVLSGSMAA